MSSDKSFNRIIRVSTTLTFKDILGGWKARWGIGRMDYKVEPGLYAVGKPDGDCAKNCPAGAITIDAGVGCAAAIIYSWVTGKEPTCGCSNDGDSACC